MTYAMFIIDLEASMIKMQNNNCRIYLYSRMVKLADEDVRQPHGKQVDGDVRQPRGCFCGWCMSSYTNMSD